MVKTSKAATKRRKARKARKTENQASRGVGQVSRGRNKVVLGMILSCKGGNHGDRRKQESKTVCRKKVEE